MGGISAAEPIRAALTSVSISVVRFALHQPLAFGSAGDTSRMTPSAMAWNFKMGYS